jgi:hypothetical protein
MLKHLQMTSLKMKIHLSHQNVRDKLKDDMAKRTKRKVVGIITLSKDNLLKSIVSGMSQTCLTTTKGITVSRILVECYLALFYGEWGKELREILHQSECEKEANFTQTLFALLKSKWAMLNKDDFLNLFREGLSCRLRDDDGRRELVGSYAQDAMRNILLDPWIEVRALDLSHQEQYDLTDSETKSLRSRARDILISLVKEHKKDWREDLVKFLAEERLKTLTPVAEPSECPHKKIKLGKVKMCATYNPDTETTTLHGETLVHFKGKLSEVDKELVDYKESKSIDQPQTVDELVASAVVTNMVAEFEKSELIKLEDNQK